jgi:hypothetical protein
MSKMEATPSLSSAHFVLTSPDETAVAIRQEGESFRVIAKGANENGTALVAAASSVRIPRIARDPHLARVVFDSVSVNRLAPPEVAQQITQYWRRHRFAPVGPNQACQFVTFRDLATNRQRLGFYVTHTSQHLEFQSFGRTVEKIPRSRITVASARRGAADRIAAVVSELDFLDYCLFCVAHKLGSRDNREGYLNVAIRTDADLPERYIREWAVHLNYLAYGGRRMVSDAIGNVFVHHLWLKNFLTALEDQVHAKFAQLGVPVVEREELPKLLEEQALAQSPQFDTRQYGRLGLATHVLMVEVGPGGEPGQYRISVRLDDADTGEVLWSGTRDSAATQDGPTEELADFWLDSGRLAALSGKRANGSRGLGLRTLPIDETKPLESRLVVVEEQTRDHWKLRDLFDKRLITLPISIVGAATTKPVLGPSDVPSDQILRYLVWRLVRGSQPLGGRITRVSPTEVDVAFNRTDAIQVGAKLRVVRLAPSESQVIIGAAEGAIELPFEMTVTDIRDQGFVASIHDLGVEVLWSDTVKIRVADLVSVPRMRKGRIAIRPPEPVPPPANVRNKMSAYIKTEAQGKHLRELTADSANQLRQKLYNALSKLGVRAAVVTSNQEIKSSQATHVIRSTIYPKSRTDRHIVLVVYSAENLNQVLDSLEFDVTAEQLESWVP